MLPLTRRRATPLTFIFIGAALLLGATLFLMLGRTPERPVGPSAFAAPAQTPAGTPTAGPWDGIEPGLRAAAEATLTAYGAALESADGEKLAAARPDLAPEARDALLAPLKDAVNVAVDLRVLAVEAGVDRASVSIARTVVIVGGTSEPPAPADETLRFVPRDGGWALE